MTHDTRVRKKVRFFDAMEKMIPNGAPSLVGCKKLVVEGEITFAKDVVWEAQTCHLNP